MPDFTKRLESCGRLLDVVEMRGKVILGAREYGIGQLLCSNLVAIDSLQKNPQHHTEEANGILLGEPPKEVDGMDVKLGQRVFHLIRWKQVAVGLQPGDFVRE